MVNKQFTEKGKEKSHTRKKIWSISLIIRDTQIQSVRYYFTPVKMAKFKSLIIASLGKDVEQ